MKCKNCHEEIAEGSKFCCHCGAKVESDAPKREYREIHFNSNQEYRDYIHELEHKKNIVHQGVQVIQSLQDDMSNIVSVIKNTNKKMVPALQTKQMSYLVDTSCKNEQRICNKTLYDMKDCSVEEIQQMLSDFDLQKAVSIRKVINQEVAKTTKTFGGKDYASKIKTLIHAALLLHEMNPKNVSTTNNQLNDIQVLLDHADVMNHKLRWLFTSSATKNNLKKEIEKSASKLQYEDFDQVVNDYQVITDMSERSEQQSYNTYKRNPKKFYELLKDDCGDFLNAQCFDVDLKDLDDVLDSYDALSSLDQKFKEKALELENVIKERAQQAIMDEIKHTLSMMPVEKVNYAKQGIRTKILRNNGYETVADLMNVSASCLMRISGIGEDSAFSTTVAVKELIQAAKEETKLKLNIDNKTTGNTGLIKTLYKALRLEESKCEFQVFMNEHEDTLDSSYYDVLPAREVAWRFGLETNPNRVVRGIENMKEVLFHNQSFSEIINTLVNVEKLNVPTKVVWDDFNKNPIVYNNFLEKIIPELMSNIDEYYGLPESLAKEIEQEAFFPEGLLCTLRKYQEWGVKYTLHNSKVIIGDEMGLGKTIQAIATMVSLRNTNATHFLVVCPASVLSNWCREIKKHSTLSVIKIHGRDRISSMNYWSMYGGVGVTTYETTKIFEKLDSMKLDFLVVDEAHYIKHEETQRAINVNTLIQQIKRVMFLTGTALENNVDEMISLIRYLRPDIAHDISGTNVLAGASSFRNKVADVYFRRKRDQVLTELPELIENEEWCSMTPEETAIYEENVMSKKIMKIRRVSWDVDDLKDSSKAQRLVEILEEAKEDHRKIIVFSFFLDTIERISELLGDHCVGIINGSVSPINRQKMIDRFDTAEDGSVLLAQIIAGGTGLNIQSASIVVLCEPQYKPSIENQAISRAYRMGQSRNVIVYRLLCEDSVDERMTNLLEKKQKIFDQYADKSVSGQESLEITDKMMSNIIQEEIERINQKKQEAE